MLKSYFPSINFSLLNIFMSKRKDPDPYIWLMDPDPDPEGPKTNGSGFPNTGFDSYKL